MANMYFAKVSVNSHIYDLMENPKMLDEITNNIVAHVSQNKTIVLGKEYKNDADMIIKFIELQNDVSKGYISGQLIKIYKEELLQYDDKEDKLKKIPPLALARTATFYFDARTGYTAFTLGQYFGKDKFCEYFRLMLEGVSDVGLNVGLVHDKRELMQKIKGFRRIDSILVDLVIPNPPGLVRLNRLFAGNVEHLKSMNAQEYKQEFSANKKSDGLNINTPLVNELTTGVADGYGEMVITGTTESDEKETVHSSKQYPLKHPIRNKEKTSVPIVMELGKKYIGWICARIKGEENGEV